MGELEVLTTFSFTSFGLLEEDIGDVQVKVLDGIFLLKGTFFISFAADEDVVHIELLEDVVHEEGLNVVDKAIFTIAVLCGTETARQHRICCRITSRVDDPGSFLFEVVRGGGNNSNQKEKTSQQMELHGSRLGDF